MATISEPVRSQNLAEAHQRVRSPLERLRGYIRTYVALEGVTVCVLYLALWFWIGLLLDYGSFKSINFDWVQDLPWGFRLVVLILLSLGLVAAVSFKVVYRLFREFNDASLALVLERRFPEILGDRLITAVELSDPAQAEAWGYSAAMVRETIHEAAQRVEKLPLREVFDWKRLRRQGFLGLGLILGVYLLTGAGFSTYDSVKAGQTQVLSGYVHLNDISGIWFERNILLRNTIWPRRAQLELIGYDAGDEIRVVEGSKPPIRVRAYKYVIAGPPTSEAAERYRAWLTARGMQEKDVDELVAIFRRSPPEGWRPLSWFDLTPALLNFEGAVARWEKEREARQRDVELLELDTEVLPEDVRDAQMTARSAAARAGRVDFTRDLIEGKVAEALPPDWAPRDNRYGITVDEIELHLQRPETHQGLPSRIKDALRDVLDLVGERGAERDMRRTLRKLIVPETVTLSYKGATTSSTSTLQRGADNEYTGNFGELKEDVTFTVQGEDYFTPKRHITVVKKPRLENLVAEQGQPAYLYFRPAPETDPLWLRGQKQLIKAIPVSLQSGDVARLEVAAGTDVALVATASKSLQAVRILPAPKAKYKGQLPVAHLGDDQVTFRAELKNVRQEQDFLFEFTDTDGITSTREIIISPREDAVPKVRGFKPEKIVRLTEEGTYMVTVSARIPFKGDVADDHALAGVRYAYTLAKIKLGTQVHTPSLSIGCAVVPGSALGGFHVLGTATNVASSFWEATQPIKSSAPEEQRYFDLPGFAQRLRTNDTGDGRGEIVPLPTIRELLPQRMPDRYRSLLGSFDIKKDEWNNVENDPILCDLPLWKAGLKVDSRLTQPIYRMELWLEGTDNDLDSAQPHVGRSAIHYIFRVVSEGDLLAEIGKEEAVKYEELKELATELKKSEGHLNQMHLDLAGMVKVEDLDNMSARCEQIASKELDKAQRAVKAVHQVYERILLEEKTNQVGSNVIVRTDKTIVTPLGELDGEFDRTREAVLACRRALDNKGLEPALRIQGARQAAEKAQTQMRRLVDRLNDILNSMSGMLKMHELIKELELLEAEEQRQFEKIDSIRKKLEEKSGLDD